MAMENKRIIQLSTERTTLGDDDYTIVDSDTNGTAKYRLSRLKETDTTLSVSGMAADAAATGQAISDEAEARAGAVTAEAEAREAAVTAEAQARQQAIAAESQARRAADTALGNDVDDLKSAMDSAESSIESLEATKADIDGFYEDMTVGTAEAVLSESYTADSVPYHFRKTPFGDRLKEKIIGGTVAWNQLLKSSRIDGSYSGLTASMDADGTVNIVGTNGGDSSVNYTITLSNGSWGRDVPANHKLLYSTTNYNGFRWERAGFATNNRKQAFVHTITISYSATVRIVVEAGETVDIHSRFNYFDLTQMFGTEIADRIYSLEQTTAGAGVVLFRQLFNKDYYPYDAGSLQSVSGLQSHDEVGFNQWDEETNIGYWDVTNGSYARSPGQLCSKNYIPVFPNATYYAFKGLTTNLGEILFYDKEKNYITHFLPSNWINRTFVTPSNCHYITFNLGSSYGTTYNHDICINISDPEKNGTYEPYKKHSYPLDSSLTLRGVPKLVDNEIKFDGDIYESDGKVTRRYGIVDLGTLTWSQADNVGRASALLPHNSTSVTSGKLNVISTKYITGNVYSVSTNDKCICTTKTSVWVQDSSFINATASEFKSAMSGIYLVYELETPTEESAQPFTNPQRCAEGGAEEYVTTGIVPVGHESEYYENIATKVDGLPYDLSMIAPIENGTTASKAYSAGQYFLHNDQFCKAKTAIASGATFTLNTNYEVTTVANELYTALH